MSNFLTTDKPYYMDLTHTYIGGIEAWEKDRIKMRSWLLDRFGETLLSDTPMFWNSLGDMNTDNGVILLRDFYNNFKRFNEWLSMILFMKSPTPKILWAALISASKDLHDEARGAPHIDFPPTECDPRYPQTDYWNGCRFILPIQECEKESRSTEWWDLKDRHKYILGSREHVNEIRKRVRTFNTNAPNSKYASIIKEEHMEEFELVSVQNLRGPALLNTTIPHYVKGSVFNEGEPYRMTFTFKPARPELIHCMLMGQTYKGRELYG